MSLAKERKINPRQLATDVLARLDVSAWCEKVELAGAGYINFRLRVSALAQALRDAVTAELPFVQKATQRTIVIDFSSPMSPSPCTWATFARRSSAIVWRERCGCWAIGS